MLWAKNPSSQHSFARKFLFEMSLARLPRGSGCSGLFHKTNLENERYAPRPVQDQSVNRWSHRLICYLRLYELSGTSKGSCGFMFRQNQYMARIWVCFSPQVVGFDGSWYSCLRCPYFLGHWESMFTDVYRPVPQNELWQREQDKPFSQDKGMWSRWRSWWIFLGSRRLENLRLTIVGSIRFVIYWIEFDKRFLKSFQPFFPTIGLSMLDIYLWSI